jgi:hypothetical protein
MKDRDINVATLFDTRLAAATNIATRTKRWNNTDKVFEDYNGATWDDLVIAIAGGGTGAATAATARTNLGLGTMATQAASAVAITGGTITDVGLAFTADGNKNIGSNTYGLGKAYIHTGLVVPVGTDKYLTS